MIARITSDYRHLRVKAGVGAPLEILTRSTALELREDMSRELGVEVYLKREDRTDDLGCGHKLRKLSYEVAEAQRCGANVLITAGSLPSNQCKAVALVCARLGLGAHLVYGGDHQSKPDLAQGNYLLALLSGAKITWHERSSWSDANAWLIEAESQERMLGRKPYVISSGISDGPGLWGSIELGFELAAQLHSAGQSACDIVAVAGSGGTCLGLAIAAKLLEKPWYITGVCIGELADQVAARCGQYIRRFNVSTGLSLEISDTLQFSDCARGKGYDSPEIAELNAASFVMKQYGLLFDLNYMIKAYLGLKEHIVSGAMRSKSVVLIHSGGQIGVFDAAQSWRLGYDGRYLAVPGTLGPNASANIERN